MKRELPTRPLHVLFVCTECKLRSATAAEIFHGREGVEVLAAGTNDDAETPLSGDLVEWADLILVMEPVHRARVTRRFGALLRDRRLVVLGVPDRYAFMQPELVALLERKVRRSLP